MTMVTPVQYADASPRVRAVFDDIMTTRGVDDVNDLWKALAAHPPTLERTWAQVKDVMGPGGRLDPLVKELVYLAVSATNNCEYCLHSHAAAARAKGMDDETFGELMQVVALANLTNRLAIAYQVPVDERFRTAPPRSPA
ncbi:MAG TPA: carboxymuconolactone decarboxylase family protein [Burkholderiaceae bacterium]|nr:carboxymuconolactone decarboxylase family protein [Burkholderiaceae bacterium]